MRRATIYDTPEENLRSPCPECGQPNGAHTQPEAMDCWRTAIRHPDADADDMLVAIMGTMLGITRAGPAAGQVAAAVLDELGAALEDRLGTATVEAEVIEA